MEAHARGQGGTIRCGFTLVELVIAAALTTFVVGAAMGLMWSVSRESLLTEADRLASLRGRAFLRRLSNILHGSRTVSVDSASQITLWTTEDYPASGTGGPPGDDAPQLSEIETIAYDGAAKRFVRTYVDFTGASAATIALLNATTAVPGIGSVNLGSILAGTPALVPYTKTEVWAEEVQSCTFAGINKGGRVVIMIVDFTIGTGTNVQTLHKTISLEGASYFVNNGAARSSDGLPGGRYRATAAWTW